MPADHQFKEVLSAAAFLDIAQLKEQIGASVILAPHPDDEALGCGGMIRYLRDQNIAVIVVFITSGNASHPNSKEYPVPVLAKIREEEARKSCEILGVDSEQLIFLKQEDARLSFLEESHKQKLIEEIAEILKRHQISSVFLPWRRDPHPDHIAAYQIGKEAVQRSHSSAIEIIEYPIWLWKNSLPQDWPLHSEIEIFKLNISSVKFEKHKAIFAHESQTTNLIQDDPEGFVLTEDLLAPFLGEEEIYFFSPKSINTLNKDYFEYLYEQNPDPWNFKNSDYELEKYQKADQILKDWKFINALEIGCSIGVQSRFFSRRSKNLLAVDVSEKAIFTAKEHNKDLKNTKFQVLDVVQNFPKMEFDFISLCEVGYYLNQEDLWKLFEEIDNHLQPKGIFLLLHWTSFVREYPLSGHQVHQLFRKFIQNKYYSCRFLSVNKRYEIEVWEKD